MFIGTHPKLTATARLSGLEWLVGRWIFRNGEHRGEEFWFRCGSTLYGRSIEMQGTETTFSERLRIEEHANDMTYHATPGGLPVTYHVAELAPGRVTFENAAHAFPRRATYARHGSRLTLTLTGHRNGHSVEVCCEWDLAEPPVAQLTSLN